MSALEWKEKGTTHFKNKNYEEALNCYSQAITLDPQDHVHYSNRSATFYNLGKYDKALEDATKCLSLKPDFSRGYLRKGMALFKLDEHEEAIKAYKQGLEIDPSNQQLKDSLNEAESASKNPLAKNFSKLYTDPRTSRYMSDPNFKNMLDFAMKDQKVLLQLVQSDPRFMDVFSVLTGVDFTKLNEEAQRGAKESEEAMKERKKREEEERRRNEELARQKAEEDKWNSLTEEQKQTELNNKKAEELKVKGNEEFKKKNYTGALNLYNQAIETNPKDFNFYLNRAGAFHELKEYDKAIEDCKFVVENTSDFQKKGRAYGRMAFACQEKGDLDLATEYFEKSLLENNDPRIKDALKELNKIKKELEEKKYINPEIAEKHNEMANELYKGGKFPDALREYNEAIRRNPAHAKYYSNRAACFIKLMEFSAAGKDCEKALELDPNFLRAYQRLATCHTMLKEYHKALELYEQAMKKFPEDKELKEGYAKVIGLINTSNPKEDEERLKHAYADPEIRTLVQDPRIQQLFKDLQENQKAANDAIMKDEFIAGAFKKLVAAGIIKTR